MLSDVERKELEHELQLYPAKKNACIDALKIVQQHQGWVSDECIDDIAEYLEMSPDEVDGTATFYNLIYRKPVGKHVILLCDCISCWILGYENILDHLEKILEIDFGQTTSDGLFTLLPASCLGVCETAPAMMVGEEVYINLTPEKIDKILENYRKNSF